MLTLNSFSVAYNKLMLIKYGVRSREPLPLLSKRPGFTIIESLIGITILTMVSIALFSVMASNLSNLFQSKARGIALAIAQEKIEDLKNLPYDSLSTQGGNIYPPGSILDNEDMTRNGLKFRIHTDIRYIDNDYDGNASGTVSGKPVDLYSYDYKKVTITITDPKGTTQLAQLSSDIAAKAAETAGNTGVLLVKVIDAAGIAVEGATVQITNQNPNPDVNITTTTDVQGQVIIPKLPPDSTPGYHVVITKAGFNSDQTYTIDAGHPTPANPDFAMLAQQITTKTFSIDQLTNLSLTITNQTGTPLSNQAVTIQGQKLTNNTPASYKVTQTNTTNNVGLVQFNLIEWDSYSVSIPGYTILSSYPFTPITAAPNGLISATLIPAPSPTQYPIITSVTPTTSTASNSVTIDIAGNNFSSASSIILRKAGETDRVASAITLNGQDSLSGTFDLTTASGAYTLIVTTTGLSTSQPNAMTVGP